MLVDFIRVGRGRPEGYTLANNDTIHIIDPTRPPTDYAQVAGALSNSLNDLFVLGAYRNIRIAPVVNAVSDEIREELWKQVKAYASSIGAEVLEVPQPDRGRLLIGATVLADTDRQPPTFYDRVEPGAKLIATRPFGELAPINIYLAAVIDESIVDYLEERGLSFEDLKRAKDEAVSYIARPNIGAAEVIAKFLPGYGEEFRRGEHIIATTDVTGPGIMVVYELAELMNAVVELWDVPLLFPEYAQVAASLLLLANATSGTNGGFVIVAPEEIADDVVRELKARGYSPTVFGEVKERGRVEVRAPRKLAEYVVDQAVLSKFKLV